MDLTVLSRRSETDLIAGLRQITLLNSPVRPYERADIRLISVPADFLFPAAHYVAKAHLERQRDLRAALLTHGIDTLDLPGSVEFQSGDEIWTVIPPVVEFQIERVEHHPLSAAGLKHPPAEIEYPLINDGLHRVWLARELGVPVRVVAVRGVSPETPYYAYPSSWSRVQLVDQVPQDKNLRKRHRIENYYSLYRDFGPLGVGKPRHPGEIRK